VDAEKEGGVTTGGASSKEKIFGRIQTDSRDLEQKQRATIKGRGARVGGQLAGQQLFSLLIEDCISKSEWQEEGVGMLTLFKPFPVTEKKRCEGDQSRMQQALPRDQKTTISRETIRGQRDRRPLSPSRSGGRYENSGKVAQRRRTHP